MPDRFARSESGREQGDDSYAELSPGHIHAVCGQQSGGGCKHDTSLSAEKEIEDYLNVSHSNTIVTLDQFYNKIEAIRENTDIHNVIIARIRDELSRTIRTGYMLTEGRKIAPIPKDARLLPGINS